MLLTTPPLMVRRAVFSISRLLKNAVAVPSLIFGIFDGQFGTNTSMVLSGTPPHQFNASSHLVSFAPSQVPDRRTVNILSAEVVGAPQKLLLTVTRYRYPFIVVGTGPRLSVLVVAPVPVAFDQVTPLVPLSVSH